MSARWREWLVRGTLMLGVPVLLIGAIEIAARLLGIGYDPAFWVAVPNVTAVATNDSFGRRFFPPGLVRTPAPDMVLTLKPANTRRIFLLGESAAMGFPEPALGLAAMLEHMLRYAQPAVHWEVHNAAMTAINSHVILPIARDCARLSPDMFIVLAGNNEAVGPYGPATVFGQTALPVSLVRVSNYVAATRLGQLLTLLLQRNAPREWRGLEMFTEQRLSASDARLAHMYEAFRQNLTAIVRAGTQVGAGVLLVTVPVNLRDCPPFDSAAPGHAQREFRLARDLLAEGRTEEASTHFRRARDLDTLRFRADTRINDIIREAAPREKAQLVDADRSFGLAGNDLFWEHVHLTPMGTFRLAGLIAAELGVRNTPAFEEVRQTLPITRWDERNIRSQIAALLQRPPFTAQTGNAERIAALRVDEDINTIHGDARRIFEYAVSRRPKDVNLLFRYACLLREAGDPRASADIFGRMIRLIPGRKAWHVSRGAALSDAGLQDAAMVEHNAALAMDADFDLAHFGLGLARARMGDHEQARRHYSDALRLNPWYAEAAYNVAGSLAALGRTQEAQRELERAVAVNPGFSRAHAALAQLHAREGRVDHAIRRYRQAIGGEPRIPEAHYDLALLLARQGRLDEAVAQYEQAIQLRPDFPEALNNLGIALAKRGDTSAAAQAFTRAIALQPSFEAARANLERIRRTVARRQ